MCFLVAKNPVYYSNVYKMVLMFILLYNLRINETAESCRGDVEDGMCSRGSIKSCRLPEFRISFYEINMCLNVILHQQLHIVLASWVCLSI